MKKTAISLLLALLCVGLLAFGVSAQETEAVHTDHCVCGGTLTQDAITLSGHTCETDGTTWLPWGTTEEEQKALPTSGSYYLVADVTVTYVKNTGNCVVSRDTTLNLCLNGHNVTDTARVFDVYGTLNLSDCQGTGTVTGNTGRKTTATSSLFYVRDAGTLNLYGGTLTQDASIAALDNAGVGQLQGSVNLYGATLSGGKAKGNGGCLLLAHSTAKLYMYGGTVQGGSAAAGGNILISNGTCVIAGGTVSGGYSTAQGGNIRVENKGSLTISGGTISGGGVNPDGTVTTTRGGNLAILAGTVSITGGTITGGCATQDGGNIRSALILTLNGENLLIENGQAPKGGNISAEGTFKLQKGTITGGTATLNGGNIYALRSVAIEGGKIENGSAVDGGNVYCVNYISKTATTTDETTGNTTVTNTMGGVTVYVAYTGLVTGGTASGNGGNIWVEGNVDISAGTVTAGTATGIGGNIYSVSSADTTVVTDTAGTTVSSSDTAYTFKITGGTISGGNAKNAGGIYISGNNLTMTKGTVSGNTAKTDGGSIYALGGAELSISGGTVTGGTANGGGNVMLLDATMNISGTAVIENGTSTARGGNIRLNSASSVVNISGGEIRNGGANAKGAAVTTYGGNICVFYGKLNITGGKLTGGMAKNDGGNIIAENSASVNITGGTVSGGNAAGKGGALCISSSGKCTVSGAEIFSGKGNNGTAIYVTKGKTLTLKDTTVTGSGTGTTIWNCGTLILSGTVSMPDELFDLMIDARNGDSYLDVAALTSTGETPITVRRWAIDTTDDDPGLIATGADASKAELFAAWKEAYYIAYADGELTLNASVIRGLNAAGEAVGEYTTMDQLDGQAGYYKLYADLTGGTIAKDMILDLNGHSLTDVTIAQGVTLSGMDSTTDDYDCANGYGTVTLAEGSLGTIAAHIKTSTDTVGVIQRYLAVPGENGTSFHRFYMGITHASLKPSTVAFGYKAAFYGDEVVRNAVSSYGYEIWVNDGEARQCSKTGAFASGDIVTLRVDNILAEDSSNNALGAAATVNARTFITFTIGGQQVTVQTTGYSNTLKNMLQTLDTMVGDMGAEKLTALKTMCQTYAQYMEGWSISNILNWTEEA